MRPSPADEWQRLTALYAEMSDEELLELSSGYSDLTESAQQVLRDELRKRRLPAPQSAPIVSSQPDPAFSQWRRATGTQPPDAGPRDGSLPHEYTWKTLLRECTDRDHAWQLSEVLKRAGIESWIEAPAESLDISGPRLLVAADQLEEARAISERPIPQDVIDQSKMKLEDFEPPSCPKCGAPDPLLLGVDPANTWRCENCGAQWTDSQAFDGIEPPLPAR